MNRPTADPFIGIVAAHAPAKWWPSKKAMA